MTEGLQLYDTHQGSIRPFIPDGPDIRVYVCGVTPYDTTHLGHAFTFAAFDVLIRYLRSLGHEVRYVQNITDVDDPLFAKARELGISPQDLAAEQTERYFADMRALNILPADVYPRAGQETAEMIDLIERLFAAGRAYQVDGHVYFSVATDPSYGELSHYSREEMIELARERGGNPDDPLRRDPLDFLLWRPAGPGEPAFPSPWGEGLPGWHIECSAMSLKYLGEPLDIHGGGSDLIFPHHESEIAQSEGATGVRPFARFWLHTGMVFMDGEKMSKSLGNMVFAHDLIQRYSSDAIRLYLAGYHYRADLYWEPERLNAAADLARALATAASLESASSGEPLDASPFRERFRARLNDDLDTPGAIAVLRELAAAIRTASKEVRPVEEAQRTLHELGGILGLTLAPATNQAS